MASLEEEPLQANVGVGNDLEYMDSQNFEQWLASNQHQFQNSLSNINTMPSVDELPEDDEDDDDKEEDKQPQHESLNHDNNNNNNNNPTSTDTVDYRLQEEDDHLPSNTLPQEVENHTTTTTSRPEDRMASVDFELWLRENQHQFMAGTAASIHDDDDDQFVSLELTRYSRPVLARQNSFPTTETEQKSVRGGLLLLSSSDFSSMMWSDMDYNSMGGSGTPAIGDDMVFGSVQTIASSSSSLPNSRCSTITTTTTMTVDTDIPPPPPLSTSSISSMMPPATPGAHYVAQPAALRAPRGMARPPQPPPPPPSTPAAHRIYTRHEGAAVGVAQNQTQRPSFSSMDRMSSRAFRNWLQAQAADLNSNTTPTAEAVWLTPCTEQTTPTTNTVTTQRPAAAAAAAAVRRMPDRGLQRSSSTGSIRMSHMPVELRPSPEDLLYLQEQQTGKNIRNDNNTTFSQDSSERSLTKAAKKMIAATPILRAPKKVLSAVGAAPKTVLHGAAVAEKKVMSGVGAGTKFIARAPKKVFSGVNGGTKLIVQAPKKVLSGVSAGTKKMLFRNPDRDSSSDDDDDDDGKNGKKKNITCSSGDVNDGHEVPAHDQQQQ